MNIEERLSKLENKISKLYEQIEMTELEKTVLINNVEELQERLSELEDNHIDLLYHMCVCNNDGGDNGSCESILHYCICEKLMNRTYDCRAKDNHHKCICPNIDWCRCHAKDILYEVKLEDDPVIVTKSIASSVNDVGGVVHKAIIDYNPRRFMRHFIARIKK